MPSDLSPTPIADAELREADARSRHAPVEDKPPLSPPAFLTAREARYWKELQRALGGGLAP